MSGSGQWRELYWLFLYGLGHIYVPRKEKELLNENTRELIEMFLLLESELFKKKQERRSKRK